MCQGAGCDGRLWGGGQHVRELGVTADCGVVSSVSGCWV